ncbi:hypothetical protein EHQ53_13520 [Leptospira langatensis]|uniref:Uncharacterized protein n=1 Tax=Leptospira langatensis TaxID=2484983 RepID=A0A5F1ZR88_9LEPT|nr:hypothetical protein [Leptospira langatensis]TGK02614.1 hypothetical protein EHO57_04590 [Leptospira langatensis]TGL40184.1 hypothetical protein EHQ53_13520 [Leptospira langatensis]
MPPQKRETSYDYVCFSELVYEYDNSKETEKKIKRRLKYYELGDYDQSRIDTIRNLKNDLDEEIQKNQGSKYYLGSKEEYAALGDFDFDLLLRDFQLKYQKINKEDMNAILLLAIYTFYLR